MALIRQELPAYDECREKVAAKEANALERFIFEYEPAGLPAERQFRERLTKALNYAAQRGKQRWQS